MKANSVLNPGDLVNIQDESSLDQISRRQEKSNKTIIYWDGWWSTASFFHYLKIKAEKRY